MPASTRGVKRDQLRFVKINDFCYYGFKTSNLAASSGISDADLLTQLGHEKSEQTSAGLFKFTGANSPKPAVFRKKFPNAAIGQRAGISTFGAYDKTAAANSGGWALAKRALGVSARAPKPNSRTIDAFVPLSNGLVYVQPCDATALTPDRLGLLALSHAGIRNYQKRLIRGCRTKPGKVRVDLGDGATAILPYGTYSPITADNIRATPGYEIISDEFIEYPTAVVPF